MSYATIDLLVKRLGLAPHPEGGYFAEVYRSEEEVVPPARIQTGKRVCGTSIYYLLHERHYSAWHRIDADEQWCHHQGGVLLVHTLDEETGALVTHRLGPVSADDDTCVPQINVKHGLWFAAECENKDEYALVGCQVFPGFDFEGFVLADSTLLSSMAQHPDNALIARLMPKE